MEKKENLRNEFVNKDNHNSKFRKADRSESEKYQIKEKDNYVSTRLTSSNDGALAKTVLDSLPTDSSYNG